MAVRSVPREKDRVWVHPESWASPAKSVRKSTFCACHGTATACRAQNVSTSIYSDVHLHQTTLYLCPFGPPEEEKGAKHMFFLFLEKYFLGLHGICSMSATNPYELVWQVIFHSVRFKRSRGS